MTLRFSHSIALCLGAVLLGCQEPAPTESHRQTSLVQVEIVKPQGELSGITAEGAFSTMGRPAPKGTQLQPQAKPLEKVETDIRLTDVTQSTDIDFIHQDGGSGQGYIVEGGTGGLALFDYNLDGWIDIYFLQGGILKGLALDHPPTNKLYRNNGDWTFTDVTEEAGVGDSAHGMGVTTGDYDNDGDEDLYINNFGPNVFYRNNGDGTFTDVALQNGTQNEEEVGAGTAFLDVDADGHLDLFVANYIDFDYENHVPVVVNDHRFKAGPQYYHPVSDVLFRNNGDGTFEDVSESSGIASKTSSSMGIICTDYDEDGDQDVFVCNDNEPNFLWKNNGAGHFEEVAVLAGLAYDFNGKPNASMGVDVGDYDNDGHLDIFLTDWQSEMPVLYRNLQNGLFQDATTEAQISNELFPHVHWGTSFVDFENDGDLDLFVACGHFDEIELIDDRTAKKVRNYLMMNRGGSFVDIYGSCGDGLNSIESSRGAGFDDLDNDGDIDAVILNSAAAPTILRNDSKSRNWLQIELQNPHGNRFGIGSRVTVSAGGKSQVAEVYSGRGYQSQYGRRLHFGLANNSLVDTIKICWPDGEIETHQNIEPNQKVVITRKAP